MDHWNETKRSDSILFLRRKICVQWEWADVSVGHVPLQLQCMYSVGSRATFLNNNKFSTKTIRIWFSGWLYIVRTYKSCKHTNFLASCLSMCRRPPSSFYPSCTSAASATALNITLICFTWKLSHRHRRREHERREWTCVRERGLLHCTMRPASSAVNAYYYCCCNWHC